MESFVYLANPARVIFGSGTISQLPAELRRLDKSAAIVLSTPNQAQDANRLGELLGSSAVATYTGATMHTPREITEEALTYAKEHKADAVVSIGGGSTIGLGKALSVQTGWPHICIPTS